MNLVEVEIEDYRQFHGLTTFSPAQQALIGIIGENGAGKTTLFEAIEWCLYNPSWIRNEDIRPRTLGGKPRVKVTLEHPLSGEQFEVERELKGRTVSASVYRVSNPDTPVVQGTKQVTEYVTKSLLGLTYQAFVATFFTRQKELHFFGNLRAAERRREVGRLLGLETIRIAQQSIGTQRQEKLSASRQLSRIYEDQSAGRDFAAERIAARALVDHRLVEHRQSDESLQQVNTLLAQVRETLSAEERRAGQFQELRLEVSRLQGEQSSRLAELAALQKQIDDIAEAEGSISKLEPVAATVAQIELRIKEHEKARKLSDQIGEMGRRIESLERMQASIDLSVLDVESRLTGASQRSVGESTERDAAELIEHLIVLALNANVADLDAQVTALERILEQGMKSRSDRERFDRYTKEFARIETEIREMLSAGDPAIAITAAVADLARVRGEQAAAEANARSLESQHHQLDRLLRRLESGQFDQPCPTCGREYDAREQERDSLALRKQLESLSSQIEGQRSAADAANVRALDVESREAAARSRLQSLNDLQVRLSSSTGPIDEARRASERSDELLTEALTATGRREPPNESEIAQAREHLNRALGQARELPLLQQLKKNLQANQVEIGGVRVELEKLGPATYDQPEHARDTDAWQRASQAAAQIVLLRERVDSLPGILSRQRDLEVSKLDLDQQLAHMQADIEALAFSPEALEAARSSERAERERYDSALQSLHAAKEQLTAAELALKRFEEDERRLQGMLQSSIEAQRNADDLDRMYKEFSRFEQFVALAVTPALAELTSQLVATVTDGKYDRVEFTEDFGIEVFDGDDDHFSLDQFSGGERDVIALCARLALSQFLGGQAGTPPQFVVMDEVFGSLDRIRRENLMEMLNRLVDDRGTFQQLFVISHVDDVRSSVAFDEVWRVDEGIDGSSQLEQLSSGSMPVEI